MLAWLLGEPRAEEVRGAFASAELVVSSSLTLIECERVLIRMVSAGDVSEALAAERRATLARTAEHWVMFDLAREVVERARRPFPREPIRTLDAIHLATAVLAQSLVDELSIVSLDNRVRDSGRLMGFRVVPE